jgi:hypothetical protein
VEGYWEGLELGYDLYMGFSHCLIQNAYLYKTKSKPTLFSTTITISHPTPTAPNITLCTAHLATCPATATATDLKYPHPSKI